MTDKDLGLQLVELKEFFDSKKYINDAENECSAKKSALESELRLLDLAISNYTVNLNILKNECKISGVFNETPVEIDLKTKIEEKQLQKSIKEAQLSKVSLESILEFHQAIFANEFLKKLFELKIEKHELKDILNSDILDTNDKKKYFHDVILLEATKSKVIHRDDLLSLRTVVATIVRAESGRRARYRQQANRSRSNTPTGRISHDITDVGSRSNTLSGRKSHDIDDIANVVSEGSDLDESVVPKPVRARSMIKRETSPSLKLAARDIKAYETIVKELKDRYNFRPTPQFIKSRLPGEKQAIIDKQISQKLNKFADKFYTKISETMLTGEKLKKLITDVVGESDIDLITFFEDVTKNLTRGLHDHQIKVTIRSLDPKIKLEAPEVSRQRSSSQNSNPESKLVQDSGIPLDPKDDCVGRGSEAKSTDSSITSPIVVSALPSIIAVSTKDHTAVSTESLVPNSIELPDVCQTPKTGTQTSLPFCIGGTVMTTVLQDLRRRLSETPREKSSNISTGMYSSYTHPIDSDSLRDQAAEVASQSRGRGRARTRVYPRPTLDAKAIVNETFNSHMPWQRRI